MTHENVENKKTFYPEETYSFKYLYSKDLISKIGTKEIVTGFAGFSDKEDYLTINFGGVSAYLSIDEVSVETLKYNGNSGLPVQAITLINRKICAYVDSVDDNGNIYLSRKKLQLDALNSIVLNEKRLAKVRCVSQTSRGMFLDVGVGLIAFMHASEITTSHIRELSDCSIKVGSNIFVVIIKMYDDSRMAASYRRALSFPSLSNEECVYGIVRNEVPQVAGKPIGYYIELSPNDRGIMESKKPIPYGTTVCVKVKYKKEISHPNGDSVNLYRLAFVSQGSVVSEGTII